MEKSVKFSPEVTERAVRMALESTNRKGPPLFPSQPEPPSSTPTRINH